MLYRLSKVPSRSHNPRVIRMGRVQFARMLARQALRGSRRFKLRRANNLL